MSSAPLLIHSLAYAGQSAADKIAHVRALLPSQRAAVHVVTALDCVACMCLDDVGKLWMIRMAC